MYSWFSFVTNALTTLSLTNLIPLTPLVFNPTTGISSLLNLRANPFSVTIYTTPSFILALTTSSLSLSLNIVIGLEYLVTGKLDNSVCFTKPYLLNSVIVLESKFFIPKLAIIVSPSDKGM